MKTQEREIIEKGILKKKGATLTVARIISTVFTPIAYDPRRTVKEKIDRIRWNKPTHASIYVALCFDMLLQNNTKEAKKYIELAITLNKSADCKLVLGNLDKVQEALNNAREDIDKARKKHKNLSPLSSYENE